LSTAMNMPMHNSVVCTEDVPFFPAGAERAGEGTYLGRSVVEALETICRVWPTNPAPADIKEPLRFDGPVLVLSGELDPVTPPRYANEAIELAGQDQHGSAEAQQRKRTRPNRSHVQSSYADS